MTIELTTIQKTKNKATAKQIKYLSFLLGKDNCFNSFNYLNKTWYCLIDKYLDKELVSKIIKTILNKDKVEFLIEGKIATKNKVKKDYFQK